MRYLLLALLVLVWCLVYQDSASAQLKICNKSTITIYAVIVYPEGTQWHSKGWWHVQPETCAVVVSQPLLDSYYYYYAHNNAMNIYWAGDRRHCINSDKAFDIILTGQECKDAQLFTEIKTGGSQQYTLTLTCPGCPKDFNIDGAVGKFRECRQTMDCTPTRDCTSTEECRQTRECRACMVKNIFTGGCSVWGNDPICEAQKVTAKGDCEARKSARKFDCERIKTSEKLTCEVDKEAKRMDCERLKAMQIAAAEPYEAAIHQSKSAAYGTGAKTIPASIRQQLRSVFHPELLDRVRWTSSWGNWTTIQTFAFEWNNMAAIVFDDIVVFKNEEDAQNNVGLWAHELEHVKQYRRYGIDGFAQMYIHKETSIESSAEDQANYVCSVIDCS